MGESVQLAHRFEKVYEPNDFDIFRGEKRKGVKYFGPNGKMLRGSKSPEGFTMTQSVNFTDKVNVNNGWGNSAGNYFAPGRHRIEFWWNDKRIGQTYFDVN